MHVERVVRSEDLLAHMVWIKRLAEALVRDPHAAADVVQETWLTAQGAALGRRWHPAQLRAWLARVARGKARDTRRSEARRSEREQRAAHPEAQPSTFEIVERGAVQREVVEAVLALEEPYRSTVLYRYLDELSIPAVAERTNATEEAVRQRLSRARKQLHGALDRRLPNGAQAGLVLLIDGGMERGALASAGGLSAGSVALGLAGVVAAAVTLKLALPSGRELHPVPETAAPAFALDPIADAEPAAEGVLPPPLLGAMDEGTDTVVDIDTDAGEPLPPGAAPNTSGRRDYQAVIVESDDGTVVVIEDEDEEIVVDELDEEGPEPPAAPQDPKPMEKPRSEGDRRP